MAGFLKNIKVRKNRVVSKRRGTPTNTKANEVSSTKKGDRNALIDLNIRGLPHNRRALPTEVRHLRDSRVGSCGKGVRPADESLEETLNQAFKGYQGYLL